MSKSGFKTFCIATMVCTNLAVGGYAVALTRQWIIIPDQNAYIPSLTAGLAVRPETMDMYDIDGGLSMKGINLAALNDQERQLVAKTKLRRMRESTMTEQEKMAYAEMLAQQMRDAAMQGGR